MIVRFSSVKTESITMFGNVAVELIKMLGGSGAVPGAISADDLPAALRNLRAKLQTLPAEATPSETNEDDDDKRREAPIALVTRAGPLLDLLERASVAKVPVMWEALGKAT